MTLSDVLKAQGTIGVDMLRQSISKVDATTKTKQSIRFESDEERIIFYGREFIELLNTGRKPTKKGPSSEMIDNLTEYAKARGFDNPESAAWAIAKTINKLGDKTHRKGGRDVYEGTVDKVADKISDAVVLFKMREARDKIKESLKGIQ